MYVTKYNMRGEIPMFDKNIKLKVTYEEYVLIRDLLMEYRNSLVRKGEPADLVNELLAKIMS